MALVKRISNDYGLHGLHNQIDEMFDTFFRSNLAQSPTPNTPRLDIWSEDDKSMVVAVEAPGYEEKDFDLSLQNGILEIKAHHKDKQEDKDGKRGYLLKEISSSYYRRIALPEYVDENNVQADLDKGVLKIKIPFAKRPEPKRIQIKAGSGGKTKLADKH